MSAGHTSDKDSPRDPAGFGGPVLGPDGRLERAPEGVPDSSPPPADASEPPLELAERPPRPEPEPAFTAPQFASPTPVKRRGGGWLLGLLIVALAVAAFALFRGMRFHDTELPIVLIDSDPSGAEVRIGGHDQGETPLAFQNHYPAQAIPVEVRAPGYQTWRGTFMGGQEVRLEVKLEAERR